MDNANALRSQATQMIDAAFKSVVANYKDEMERAWNRGDKERVAELDHAMKQDVRIATAPGVKLLQMIPEDHIIHIELGDFAKGATALRLPY